MVDGQRREQATTTRRGRARWLDPLEPSQHHRWWTPCLLVFFVRICLSRLDLPDLIKKKKKKSGVNSRSKKVNFLDVFESRNNFRLDSFEASYGFDPLVEFDRQDLKVQKKTEIFVNHTHKNKEPVLFVCNTFHDRRNIWAKRTQKNELDNNAVIFWNCGKNKTTTIETRRRTSFRWRGVIRQNEVADLLVCLFILLAFPTDSVCVIVKENLFSLAEKNKKETRTTFVLFSTLENNFLSRFFF